MKKLLVLFFIAAVAVSLSAVTAYGETEHYTPAKKLGRGLANVVTCPLELTKGISDVNEEKGMFAGLTWGVVQGTVDVAKRAVVGVYEILTFPMGTSDEPIIDDPEYFLDDKPQY